jgi:hypothetical protein
MKGLKADILEFTAIIKSSFNIEGLLFEVFPIGNHLAGFDGNSLLKGILELIHYF